MKKVTILVLVAGLIAIAAYFIARHTLATPHFFPPRENRPQAEAAESEMDLRPQLIKKLQELVLKGSDSLYNLSIREVEPDILASSIIVRNIKLRPDSSRLSALKRGNALPSDVFTISLDSIRITGIGLQDLLNTKQIDLHKILLSKPVIHLTHYGEQPKKRGSFQEKISALLEHFSAEEIRIADGTLIAHQGTKTTRFNHLNILLADILMDSSTLNDRDRFLFARRATLSVKDLSFPSASKDYDYKIGAVEITAEKKQLVARNIKLVPRLSRTEWTKKNALQAELFTLSVPKLQLQSVDWQSIMNAQSLRASTASIASPVFHVYLNRNSPPPSSRSGNYPQQMLMKIQQPVRIDKVFFSNGSITYEEANPLSGQTGKFFLTNLNGTVTNVTNEKDVIRNRNWMTVKASSAMLGQIPATMSFDFDLANAASGNFRSSLSLGSFDGTLLNPVAEPLGLFHIKKGHVTSMKSSVTGNTKSASGNVLLLYESLHIDAMEKDRKHPGQLDKKNVTSFLANTLLIKKENPSGKKAPREETSNFVRPASASFMNLVWKTTFVGILKTLGAPTRLANQ